MNASRLDRPSALPRFVALALAVVGGFGVVPGCCGLATFFEAASRASTFDAGALAYAMVAFLAWGFAQLWFYVRRAVDVVPSARTWWASTAVYNLLLAGVSLFVAVSAVNASSNLERAEPTDFLLFLGPAWFLAVAALALKARDCERRAPDSALDVA